MAAFPEVFHVLQGVQPGDLAWDHQWHRGPDEVWQQAAVPEGIPSLPVRMVGRGDGAGS